LVAHLALVHDVADQFLQELRSRWPNLPVDQHAVLFGAATHDIGKVLHPDELDGPGHDHEKDRPWLLERLGIPAERARFARTHGTWNHETDVMCEDLLVALADTCWKGQRDEKLVMLLASRIASLQGIKEWKVVMALDEMVERVAGLAEERLAWQRRFPGCLGNAP